MAYTVFERLKSPKLVHIFSLLFLLSCQPGDEKEFEYELGSVAAFSEMINAGVKDLALSSPLSPNEMDRFEKEAKEVAARHNVMTSREKDLLMTNLFPEDIVKGKEVLILYQGTTLQEYETLKRDKEDLNKEGKYNIEAREAISRRFGRLLSYSPQKINNLLASNTDFRTMKDFGIRANNLFLYYKDLPKATEFYTKTLGMELVSDYGMASILRMTADSYLILVDATKGMHTSDEPKSVALALLTNQLDEWYQYLSEKEIPIKYDYKPKEGGAHDGFVAIDPEGYLLEFERFKQHPENEPFIPLLDNNTTINAQEGSDVPPGLGFHSTITWLYYRDVLAMQNFYEQVLGLTLVADQGWTKIYQGSNTGFIGLVDERRGMNKYSDEKAVNVSFLIDDIQGWFDYVNTKQPFELRSDSLGTGPEGKYKAFVGYDPEKYYMEFDKFFSHPDNDILMKYLEE